MRRSAGRSISSTASCVAGRSTPEGRRQASQPEEHVVEQPSSLRPDLGGFEMGLQQPFVLGPETHVLAPIETAQEVSGPIAARWKNRVEHENSIGTREAKGITQARDHGGVRKVMVEPYADAIVEA